MAIHAHGHSPKGLLCNAGAGAAAGVIAATFVCPIDVIKTRIQVHALPQLSNANVKRLSYSWKFGTHISKGGLSWYVPWTLSHGACIALKLGSRAIEASGARAPL